MTTAEANNERATVEEFRARLAEVIRDARAAGLPETTIAWELAGLAGGAESWELRHAMLVDALAEVKRQAGVR